MITLASWSFFGCKGSNDHLSSKKGFRCMFRRTLRGSPKQTKKQSLNPKFKKCCSSFLSSSFSNSNIYRGHVLRKLEGQAPSFSDNNNNNSGVEGSESTMSRVRPISRRYHRGPRRYPQFNFVGSLYSILRQMLVRQYERLFWFRSGF